MRDRVYDRYVFSATDYFFPEKAEKRAQVINVNTLA